MVVKVLIKKDLTYLLSFTKTDPIVTLARITSLRNSLMA